MEACWCKSWDIVLTVEAPSALEISVTPTVDVQHCKVTATVYIGQEWTAADGLMLEVSRFLWNTISPESEVNFMSRWRGAGGALLKKQFGRIVCTGRSTGRRAASSDFLACILVYETCFYRPVLLVSEHPKCRFTCVSTNAGDHAGFTQLVVVDALRSGFGDKECYTLGKHGFLAEV